MIAYPTDDGGTVWVTGGDDLSQRVGLGQASGDASEPKPYAEHKHKG